MLSVLNLTNPNTLFSQLHEICNFMYKVVGERYRGSERIAVGGFMFLRFLCPAIVAPEAFGLVGGTLCYYSPSPYLTFLFQLVC